MPFIPHTPEALLPRSDSKNPNATCRGLTSSGRSCRRPISGSPGSSKSGRLSASTIASPLESSPDVYCWQHKDQARQPTSAAPQGLQNSTIKERTSVDTLIDRLGLLEFEEQHVPLKLPRQSKQPKASYSEGPPQSPQPGQQVRPPHLKPKQKPKSNLGLFCCIGEVDDAVAAPRPARKPQPPREKLPMQRPKASANLPSRQSRPDNRPAPSSSPSRQRNSPSPHRPSLSRDPSSRTTAKFLSLIPKSTAPETTALLITELAKSVSNFDEEGYIYMFWLTSTDMSSTPPIEAASSLLEVPGRPGRGRSTSDVLKTFSDTTSSRNASGKNKDREKDKTILLKIGRASNVQRRLNEWSRQCGYNLSLIRYYPYHPSSPRAEEPPRTPRKVPHAHKVERLIHIELQGKKAGSGRCEACGREHREWFEVAATRDGVKGVDEVVRRWVDWAIGGGGI